MFDQTSSNSESSGPPAGGSSSRGHRNTRGAALGFSGGLRRGGDSHGPGRNDSGRRSDTNDNWDRDNRRDIAHSTLQILDDGEYFPPGQDGPYNLKAKILGTDENTRYYGPDAGEGGEISESEFIAASNSANPDPPKRTTLDNAQTTIYVGDYSTVFGARRVHFALARNPDPSINKKIGVLNFASAKKPGGEFIIGSQGQEKSLIRASTLFASLITDAASQFYAHHLEDPGNAYYSHAMVYSPGIVLIRDDIGEWRSPVEVDVLTSAAVNAGEIRQELEREEHERVELEYWKRRGGGRRFKKKKALAERQRLPGVENENEEIEKGEVENTEENQENTIDSPESALRSDSDSRLKGAEENTESKGTMIQDDQNQPEASPEVNQEPTSSSNIAHLLSPPTQPSQAPDSNPNLTYSLALNNAEIQIQHTMYARISRILHLFQLNHTPHLILGSFGTGDFKNRVDLVANIFADLLIKPGGRFKDVFQTVVFAILGKGTRSVFSDVFLRADKRAKKEKKGNTNVFVDLLGRGSWIDGDVREPDGEKTMRMMRWKARRRKRNCVMYAIPDAAADTASFDPALGSIFWK